MAIKQARTIRTPTALPQRPQESTLVLKTTVGPARDEHALSRALHAAVCDGMSGWEGGATVEVWREAWGLRVEVRR